ncbi:MAG: transglutaminase family protein [Candidatus Pelagadaptatus aseana]|uniref:transglutaminase-like domain-containing protein n=1 Tax=Candidatus Pelagadaptatus aseana TaxID=3120508 RepID=UPI0039B17963
MQAALQACLQATPTIQSDDPAIIAYSQKAISGCNTDKDKALALYYAVRDDIRYDPYKLQLTVTGMSAVETLNSGRGWCVPKAILLAACCRAVGIPAKLGFADVCNHLSTARMRAVMKTDVFYWHGYTSIYLDNQWVKATPAFNLELCEKFGLHPLEFDGEHDSLYHEFDQSGNKHMEYLNDRGEYDDLPLETIQRDLDELYPGMMAMVNNQPSFDQDVAAEVSH